MVDKLDDIYNVGTFCQVTEMRNVDDKLRLVLLGHRRIKITDIAKPAEPKKTGEKVEEEQKADVVDKIVQVSHNPLVASLFFKELSILIKCIKHICQFSTLFSVI